MNKYIDGIKIIALAGVIDPDDDAILRDIFRWYSQKFHTPLYKVEELPLDHVLLHWFECEYQEMEPQDRHNLAIELLETPEEKELRMKSEQEDEEDFIRLAQEENLRRSKRINSNPKSTMAEKAFAKHLKKASKEKSLFEDLAKDPEAEVTKFTTNIA